MRAARVSRRRTRGSALTELVVFVPVLIAVLYGSMYLMEAGIHKLKAQEVARYATWAFTMRPLSDYGAEDFDHAAAFTRARESVRDELDALYALDLDAARDGLLALTGKRGQVLSAQYASPAGADLRNGPVSLVPAFAQVDFVEPLSGVGIALAGLNLGPGLDDIVSGMFERLDLDMRSQITGRANVTIHPPIVPADHERARAMAGAGELRGADLARWSPPLTGKRLRDRGGAPIANTLIADPWRVTQGFAADPRVTEESKRHFLNVVRRFHDRIASAVPGGGLIGGALGLGPLSSSSLAGLAGLFPGLEPERNDLQVMSYPYTQERQAQRPQTSGSSFAQAEAGQVNLFRAVGRRPQEPRAVQVFETLPLFRDPRQLGASGTFQALRRRGPNFMGCQQVERRGCRP